MNTEIEKIQALNKKIDDIYANAKSENRQVYDYEKKLAFEMQEAVTELEGIEFQNNRPETLVSISRNNSMGGSRGYGLRGPQDKKDYQSLYGSANPHAWADKSTSFFSAVFSGRHHPGLIKAGMTETVPSDGGFLVPGELAKQIHNVALESEIIMPRCFVQPMKSNSINIPAMAIGDHSANLYGGFTASYVAEAGTISENDPKTRSMELNAKKLTGLIRFSAELAQDIPGGENQIIQICGKGLGWYRDRAFLKGTGAGEPLGILNAPCTIEVAKENGQVADTIMYENLVNMLGRLHPACFNNAVWICQVSAIPQLLQLSMAVGTGGSAIPVLSESNGEWRILTRPVIFTEKTEKLGDKGDVILADLSQYVVGIRGEMRFDQSIHVHFTTDELLARLIERHDGQPLWNAPLTIEDGVTTVSPFVVLGAR
jgi:HK97 family phage major capsid protein